MVDVEARELAVADEIDAGLFLGMDDDAGGIEQRLLGRQRRQPIRHRIGADHGGLDAWFGVAAGLHHPMLRGRSLAAREPNR